MRSPLAFAAAVAVLLCGSAVRAQEASDRFSMTPSNGGFLRLDKQTGAVSFCTVESAASVCRIGADERVALEDEIARLRRENAELKAAQGGVSALPKDEEIERALTLTERFFRRFMRLFGYEPPGDKIQYGKP
ncbi:MAG TPA: hypothetical protein VED87_02280 [Methylocystis sp.]|nr:hypothetical protein [Methylocystis sp.]